MRYRALNRATLLHAELALAQRAYAHALEHATRAMEGAEHETMRKNMARSLLLQGGALLGLGRLDQAVECLQQALALADRIEHGALLAGVIEVGRRTHTGKPSRGLYQEWGARPDARDCRKAA
ncbi:MAG: hypothetical protein R2838_00150 [Caldilineaceae bacterium]